jgi:pyridoxamine 5'-phosphate oxidase
MNALRGWASFPDELPVFDPVEVPATPAELFLAWLNDAGEHGLAPHATVLSTVDADGEPDARVVILKDVGEPGFFVASSASSPKGQQLDKHPSAALTFFWPERGRQVRVRGSVEPTSAEVSAADFQQRSPASRAECLVGRQSEVLAEPTELVAAAAAARARVDAEPDLVAPHWTRYRIVPETVEFWQADHDRRHVRLRYRATDGGGWRTERLWP